MPFLTAIWTAQEIAAETVETAKIAAVGTNGLVDWTTLDAYYTQGQVERAIRGSREDVWAEVALAVPSLLTQDEEIQWPNGAERIAINAPNQLLSQRPLFITEVERSNTNVPGLINTSAPFRLRQVDFGSRYMTYGERWCCDGQYLWVLPLNMVGRKYRIHYVPTAPRLDIQDPSPITAIPAQFQRIIPVKAALKLLGTENFQSPSLQGEVQELMQQLLRTIQPQDKQEAHRTRPGGQRGN